MPDVSAYLMKENAEQKAYIENTLKDPYNAYCVDCKEEPSTHFNVGFGIWICTNCAKLHVQETSERVKPAYGEIWDLHTLKVAHYGGNQQWHDYLEEYKSSNKVKPSWRYKNGNSKWYKRNLQMRAYGVAFSETKPPKNFKDTMNASMKTIESRIQMAMSCIISIIMMMRTPIDLLLE